MEVNSFDFLQIQDTENLISSIQNNQEPNTVLYLISYLTLLYRSQILVSDHCFLILYYEILDWKEN